MIPGLARLQRLPRQLRRISPFQGTIQPARVPLFRGEPGRPSLPFPHPWNYREPLRILDTYFWKADEEQGPGRHNRYLDVPGFAPVLVTRDPHVIRAILTETGDKPGQFDRDTLPSVGIARATGRDTLLYANGPGWKRQKQLAAPPFSKSTLYQPEQFHEFEETFRRTVRKRLAAIRDLLQQQDEPLRVQLEAEIKPVMLELLTNNFFGAEVPYDEIRNRYVPALEMVIDHIVRDTVVNKLGIPIRKLPAITRRGAQLREAYTAFEDLTTRVIAVRRQGRGLWKHFRSDAPDELLRSNIRVFLAGALEATTSYASWAISHLARNEAAQEKLHDEIQHVDSYTPDHLAKATYLGQVLDETLRLTPSLYFLPRRATVDTLLEPQPGQTLRIESGTHVLLDVWHCNRHEDHWGVAVTGYPADIFVPERWEAIPPEQRSSRNLLHFGFGHGPRFCPGKSLGQMEVALVVGAFVKLFRFRADHPDNPARAGVSTKPADGVAITLEPRPLAVTAALQASAGS